MNSVVLAVTAFTVGLGRGTAAFPSAQKSQEAFAVRQSLGHTFNSIGNRPGRHAGWYSDLPGSPASAKPSAAGRAGRLREECLQDPRPWGPLSALRRARTPHRRGRLRLAEATSLSYAARSHDGVPEVRPEAPCSDKVGGS